MIIIFLRERQSVLLSFTHITVVHLLTLYWALSDNIGLAISLSKYSYCSFGQYSRNTRWYIQSTNGVCIVYPYLVMPLILPCISDKSESGHSYPGLVLLPSTIGSHMLFSPKSPICTFEYMCSSWRFFFIASHLILSFV